MQTRYRSEIFNKVLEFFNSFWEFVREEGRPIGSFCKKSIQRVRTQTRDILHKFTSLDIVLGGLSVSIMFVGGLVVFGGLGILIYQSFLWLQEGVWSGIPMLSAFNYFFQGTALHGWVDAPQSWLGLHEMVKWCLLNIPLSLVLIVDGLAVIFFVAAFMTFGLSFRLYQFKGKE